MPPTQGRGGPFEEADNKKKLAEMEDKIAQLEKSLRVLCLPRCLPNAPGCRPARPPNQALDERLKRAAFAAARMRGPRKRYSGRRPIHSSGRMWR